MKMKYLAFAALIITGACSRQEVKETTDSAVERAAQTASRAADRVEEQFDTAIPLGERPTREQIEAERFSAEWRRLRSLQEAQKSARPAPAAPAQPATANVKFVTSPKFSEKLDTQSLGQIEAAPVQVPIRGDVAGPSVVRAQVMLDRAGYSVGVLDGRWGKNSAISVYWFQRENGIAPTGDLDEATFRQLWQHAGSLPAIRDYAVTAQDVRGPFTPIPEDVYEQEKLDCLCYETALEALAEKFHTTKDFLKLLNPQLSNESLSEGSTIRVPNVREPRQDGGTHDITKLVISIRGSYINGLSADGRVVFHAPTTLGSKYDPSPNETLKVTGIAHDPHFHYQPTLFHEVPDTDPEANLQPGPNSPVGVVWMALSKPHYGIHGTNDPDSIGYASSHGCVRLTNWDARDLSYRIEKGVTVEFVDSRKETS